jgi:hypothetical protein
LDGVHFVVWDLYYKYIWVVDNIFECYFGWDDCIEIYFFFLFFFNKRIELELFIN